MTNALAFGAILTIFRGPFLERVARGKHQSTMRELGEYFSAFSPPALSNPLGDWFEFFYELLNGQYQCEYVFKNVVTTNLYLDGRHSLENSLLTSEFRSGKSRADMVIINGTSTVYEVKSKYDSLKRLEGQIADYRKLFDRIVVVTTTEKAKEVLERVDPIVGVMILGNGGNLDEIREAQSNKASTSPAAIFDCMRRTEFCSAVKEAFGYVPNVPNSRIYQESKALFCQLAPDEAHELMVGTVRLRGKRKPFAELIEEAPNSLKHACLSFSRSQASAFQVKEKLKEPLLI